MCQKTVFHPTGPCCGAMGLCKRFPSIDWSRTAWKLTHPGARWAEVLYVPKSYGGPVVNFGAGDPDNGKYSYSGVIGSMTGVLFSWHGYHMPSGEFKSTNPSACQWQVDCRERICPWQYRLAICSESLLNAESIVSESQPWEQYRGLASGTGDPVSGPFVFWNEAGGGERFFSWRSILRAAECVVIPALEAEGAVITEQDAIEGGLLYRLQNALQSIQTPSNDLPWLNPHAIDRAVAFTLSGGIRFGVEFDKRSPFYRQLVIYEGGLFDSETIGDVTTSWLVSSPWTLVSGDSNSPGYGSVLRFERTDDNDCLPAWLELELIRI